MKPKVFKPERRKKICWLNLIPHHLCNLVTIQNEQIYIKDEEITDVIYGAMCKSGGGFNSNLSLLYALRAI